MAFVDWAVAVVCLAAGWLCCNSWIKSLHEQESAPAPTGQHRTASATLRSPATRDDLREVRAEPMHKDVLPGVFDGETAWRDYVFSPTVDQYAKHRVSQYRGYALLTLATTTAAFPARADVETYRQRRRAERSRQVPAEVRSKPHPEEPWTETPFQSFAAPTPNSAVVGMCGRDHLLPASANVSAEWYRRKLSERSDGLAIAKQIGELVKAHETKRHALLIRALGAALSVHSSRPAASRRTYAMLYADRKNGVSLVRSGSTLEADSMVGEFDRTMEEFLHNIRSRFARRGSR